MVYISPVSQRLKRYLFIILFGGVLLQCQNPDPSITSVENGDTSVTAQWYEQIDIAKIQKRIKGKLSDVDSYPDSIFDSYQSLSHFETAQFYKSRDYAPFWLNSSLIDSVWGCLNVIHNHGLLAEDYNFQLLNNGLAKFKLGGSKTKELVKWEIQFTESLLLLSNHLFYGKLNPEDFHTTWNLPPVEREYSSYEALLGTISSKSLASFFNNSVQSGRDIAVLLESQKKYQEIAKNSSWEPLVFTDENQRKIEPEQEDSLVSQLRKRLFLEGYADSTVFIDSSITYNGKVLEALQKFQRLHGLNNDGVLGKKTLVALNISAKERLKQIELNIERVKWFEPNLNGDFISVNIPYYQLTASLYGEDIWNTRVIVGKQSTKTPVFTSDLKSVVINPTWTLPYSIASRETLPHLKKDSLYLEKHNMILLDHDGEFVQSTGQDWHQYTQKTFPYIVRQGPGNTNSLGRIKFLFPNKHYIYLHDTPGKNLFRTETRSYSHGCVRTENPKELARRILNDSVYWNNDSIQMVLDSMETMAIRVKAEFPVYLLYITATSNNEGELVLLDDVYQYDDKVYKAMKVPVAAIRED